MAKESIHSSCIYSIFGLVAFSLISKKVWNLGLLIGGMLGNPKVFLNDIQERRILEKFIELEELLVLDEMIEEYSETRLHKLRIGVQKRNDPINQDTQRGSYPYDFALLDKYNLFCYSK